MKKSNKYPTLFKVKLMKDTYYNKKGDRLAIKMVESGDIYYYDSEEEWTVLDKNDEGVYWKRLNGKRDLPKSKWVDHMPDDWE